MMGLIIVVPFVTLQWSGDTTTDRTIAAPRDTTAPTAGRWTCWDPGYPSPCHEPLSAVALLPSGDGWTVGGHGAILRGDGRTWHEAASPTGANLSAVAMVSATDGWAVGWKGIAMHWDGVQWDLAPPPHSGPALSGVAMVSPADAWAVGEEGTIAHWNGWRWTEVPSPTERDLRSLAMTSASDGWAVGDGVILHWDGNCWASLFGPAQRSMPGVTMASADDGWAVGRAGAITQWDGAAWVRVAAEVVPLDIAMISATDGRIVGSGVLHWDGQHWTKFPSATIEGLLAVAMVSPTDAWAVGGQEINRWDGRAWFFEPYVFAPMSYLNDVAITSATDGWAVGVYTLLHWDGQRWTEFSPMDGSWLNGVAMASDSDGWIVGNRGLFLRYTAPTDTPPTPTPTGTTATATAPVTPRPTSTSMATPTPMAGAPTDMTCSLLWPPGVRIEWTDRSDFETAFAIEAAAGAAPFDPFMLEWRSTTATTGARITYESPIALAGEATYRWRVRAVNLDTGQSTLPSAPSAPCHVERPPVGRVFLPRVVAQ